ncbi:MAG: hypothetical protein HY815_00800 [Candidatus Riflebacteria bacterium]|nr:hypothetical protein [Candidatus Riflebacteria bacterium]
MRSSDVPAIRSAKLCLETLKRTKLGSRRIKVVYNHLSMEGVSSKDVQDFINCPVYAEICCDREAVTSAYLSRTPFLLGEMNQISKDVETLTEKIFSGREAL